MLCAFSMRQRELGTTGLSVTELGLGTWGLAGEAYGPVAAGESLQVIERARAMGLTLFETSTNYATGRLEEELGQVLKGDEQSVIVTKWGTDETAKPKRKCFDASFLHKTSEDSLRRLGNPTRVVALLHNPSLRSMEDGTAVNLMRTWTQEKRLASWGVSTSDTAVADAALRAEAPVLSLPYNILHVDPLRSLSEKLAKSKTGVLVHSVLAYGLLVGRWSPSKEFPASDHRAQRWPDGALRGRLRQLDAVRPLVSGEVTTMRAAALRFALCPEVVSGVILGPRAAAQLDQLVREGQAEPPYLSPPKLSGLEGRLSHLNLPR